MIAGLPAILPGAWRGVILEHHDLGCEQLWSTTLRRAKGAPRRQWFARHVDALAHGASQADKYGLPLIDLAGSEAE